jgi:signal transduction histidine kinase
MLLKSSIKRKLIAWLLISVVIFGGTMLVLYVNVRFIVQIPERIVSKNLEIASEAKKMHGYLLSMLEYEKKFRSLKTDNYISLFLTEAEAYKNSLVSILDLESGFRLTGPWKKLHASFVELDLPEAESSATGADAESWIPENVINGWIHDISEGLKINEREIVTATRDLKNQYQAFGRNVLWGLVVLCLAGMVFVVFLSISIIRPLRELRNGILSVSRAGPGNPIRVRSKDEFGELAATFNEMTAQLMEEERMRSDFISMLSHEIRTPLTSIRESVNMITEEVMGPINGQQRKFMTIAGSEIGRISDLLKRLMQTSRLQSGMGKINPQPLETASFLSECVQRANHIAENKRIIIETDIPDNLPKLMGDPDHLYQVFLNLIGNAVKFSESGGKITVRAARKGRKRLEIFVSDQGVGIPEDEQSMIFNKYYRGKEIRSHMDGTGLGLTISKHIIEVHRGRLWVKSTVGEGSTFGVVLPNL